MKIKQPGKYATRDVAEAAADCIRRGGHGYDGLIDALAALDAYYKGKV